MGSEVGVLDDRDLIIAVLDGDVGAFQTIYQQYADRLYRFLWRRTGRAEVAEDLVQELFLKVWRRREQLSPDGALKAYLFQAANRLAIDHLRRQVASGGDAVELKESDKQAQADELGVDRRRIFQAIDALPKMQRRVFRLSRFEGLTYEEIGHVLEISIKTVENHMGRALKTLRTELHDMRSLILWWWL